MSHPASEEIENNVAFKIPDGPTQKQNKVLTCQTPRTYVAVSVYLSSTDLLSFFFCFMEIRLLLVLSIQLFSRSYSFFSCLFIPL